MNKSRPIWNLERTQLLLALTVVYACFRHVFGKKEKINQYVSYELIACMRMRTMSCETFLKCEQCGKKITDLATRIAEKTRMCKLIWRVCSKFKPLHFNTAEKLLYD